jgi:hypothetical protein
MNIPSRLPARDRVFADNRCLVEHVGRDPTLDRVQRDRRDLAVLRTNEIATIALTVTAAAAGSESLSELELKDFVRLRERIRSIENALAVARHGCSLRVQGAAFPTLELSMFQASMNFQIP